MLITFCGELFKRNGSEPYLTGCKEFLVNKSQDRYNYTELGMIQPDSAAETIKTKVE